jgi:hypothetical protein
MVKNAQRSEVLKRTLAVLPAGSQWHRRLKEILDDAGSVVGVHLAVFIEPYLTAVLEGRKTMESRFGVTRQPPYACIDPGDIILLKRSGGAVVGLAEAGEARSYVLSPEVLDSLRDQYSQALLACSEEFWEARKDKNYATLIELRATTEVEEVSIPKRDRRGWVSYGRARQTVLALA